MVLGRKKDFQFIEAMEAVEAVEANEVENVAEFKISLIPSIQRFFWIFLGQREVEVTEVIMADEVIEASEVIGVTLILKFMFLMTYVM